MQKTKLRYMNTAALCASLTAVCAQIMLPLPFTPIFFSLAVFAVFLTGALLPPVWAASAQLCYLTLGCVGMPVFGGLRGGLGVVLGPTGGYLFAYPLMALTISRLLQGRIMGFGRMFASCVFSLIVCYTLGTAWYCMLAKISITKALELCIWPFIIPDLFKGLAAAFMVKAISKTRVLPISPIYK